MPSDHADRLAEDPRVRLVEENATFELNTPATSARTSTTLNGADLWYLDRIDERHWNGAGGGARDNTYEYCGNGYGVTIYVLDLPVDTNHVEFSGRTISTVNFTATPSCAGTPDGWHGTAVASVAAGKYIGVAPSAKIVSVAVTDCNRVGTLSSYIAGLNWIAGRTGTDQISTWSGIAGNPDVASPGVINFSGFRTPRARFFDSGASRWYPSAEIATKEVVDLTGFPFITAANNFSIDTANYTPSNLGLNGPGAVGLNHLNVDVYVPPSVLTVGGTMIVNGVDYRWQEKDQYGADVLGRDRGSNSGAAISLWAPAKDIYAARHGGFNGTGSTNLYGYGSGTSFSSPIVAGLAARYIDKTMRIDGLPRPSVSNVYSFLLSNATYSYAVGGGQHAAVQGTTTPAHTQCKDTVTLDIFGILSGSCPVGSSFVGSFPASTNTSAGLAFMQETVSSTGSCRLRPTQ